MNPLLSLVLFFANLLALAVTLSVLILALAQYPGDKVGRAVVQFLGVLSFYTLAVMVSMAVISLNSPPQLVIAATNLSVDGFALCTVGAFSLIVSFAGLMKQAFQVLARAGVCIIMLIQWPLWTGRFFISESPSLYFRMEAFAPAGFVCALAALAYIALTVGVALTRWRQLEPTIVFGVGLLLLGEVLAVISPTLREVGIASLLSIVATGILGYRLSRMQLFNPLLMQTAQLAALRDVTRALMGTQDLETVLSAVARQSRKALDTDLVLVFVRPSNSLSEPLPTVLTIGGQDGGTISLIGRQLLVGDGLSGRVFLRKEPIRLPNYRAWDGKASILNDVPINATMSVPLLYDNDVVGVLNASTLKPGRAFTDRDQAMLEMLAPQAAIAIVNARLRGRIIELQIRADNQPA